MDWGTAKIREEEDVFDEDIPNSEFSVHTRYGSLIGSPMYMAPEQAKENDEISFASDLFALGLIL